MRSRTKPRLGGSVLVIYLGATAAGVVEQIEDGGRRLVVLTEEGSRLSFALNSATGTFALAGRQWEARLRFDDEADGGLAGITIGHGGG